MIQFRLWVLRVSAVVALGAWQWIPGTTVDRALFSTGAGSFANPLLFVSGKKNAAAAVHAWEAPDPTGLAAMEMAASLGYQA